MPWQTVDLRQRPLFSVESFVFVCFKHKFINREKRSHGMHKSTFFASEKIRRFRLFVYSIVKFAEFRFVLLLCLHFACAHTSSAFILCFPLKKIHKFLLASDHTCKFLFTYTKYNASGNNTKKSFRCCWCAPFAK